MVKKLSELPVGAKVKDVETKYNGKPIVWQVGGHNHYANGQTVLVSEKIITLKAFDAKEASNGNSGRKDYGNNRYSQSNIRQWLNSSASSWYSAQHSADAPPNDANVWSNCNEYDAEPGFLTNFSENMRNVLIPTTLTVAKNTVTDGGGSETVTDKVFLLSNTEAGLTNENNIAEGKRLALFTTADSPRLAHPTAEAVLKSEYTHTNLVASKAWNYWLRTPYAGYSYNALLVHLSGTLSYDSAYNSNSGVRPALNLSSDILVSDSVDSDGAYTIVDFKTSDPLYLFALQNNAYTVANGILKELGTIDLTTLADTFKNDGLTEITAQDLQVVGQSLGRAKIIKMDV